MALRNAFENLATEAKQDGIIGLLRAILRSTNYARTVDDQMRVSATVVNGSILYSYGSQWGYANANPGWYSSGAPTAMDAREQQMMLSHVAVSNAMQRWTIT